MTYYEIPKTFKEWRQFAHYSVNECAIAFDVTQRTIKNWESGKIEPPRAVFICLMLFSGRLDFLGKRWRGFRITTDCIESPEGDFVRCEEIRALRYAMQALDMRREAQLNADKKPENVRYLHEAAQQKKAKKLTGKTFLMVKSTLK